MVFQSVIAGGGGGGDGLCMWRPPYDMSNIGNVIDPYYHSSHFASEIVY